MRIEKLNVSGSNCPQHTAAQNAENMEIWRKRELEIEPQGLLMNV